MGETPDMWVTTSGLGWKNIFVIHEKVQFFDIPKTSSAFLLLHQGNLYDMMILMLTTQANELERGCTLAAYVIPRLGQGISVHILSTNTFLNVGNLDFVCFIKF